MRKKKQIRAGREYFRVFYRGNRMNFALTLVLSAVGGLTGAAASWLLGVVTDAMTVGDMEALARAAGITALAIPVLCVLIWLDGKVKARFIRKAMSQYKALAFSRICEKSISAFSRENTGRYLSALTNDAAAIESQYLEYIPNMVQSIISFAVSLGIMLYCSPILTLILVAACMFPIAVSLVMSGGYTKLEKAVSDESEGYTSGIKDLLSGFLVIKSFKAEAETQRLFNETGDRLERTKERKRGYGAWVDAVSSAAGLTAQLGTFLAGAFLAIRGDITPGTVMLFVNLCNSVLNPIQTVPTYWAGIRASGALVDKLAELTRENAAHGGERIAAQLQEAIVLEKVSFGYEEGKMVLQDVSLRLDAGKKYAIVGASGSGKSTLLNLLMGAYSNYSGAITIDGREMRNVDPGSLYELVSLIGQNVFLFDTTIRENITLFRTFPVSEVDSAAERSGLAEVIREKGEDYRCGENGVGLSGGERQRLSIARCLLRKTSVLMLDEATAALDNQTAFEVTDAILKLEGMTRIVVTHRLEEALLRRYDEIIVLRDGRITEQGSYEELMSKTGYFYSLYHVSN